VVTAWREFEGARKWLLLTIVAAAAPAAAYLAMQTSLV
jgi:hypothetical protein